MYLISWNKSGKDECIRVRNLDDALTIYDVIRKTWIEMTNVGFYESVDPEALRPEKVKDPDCEYYRNMYGGICFAQKGAPRCECLGIKERCSK